MPYNITQEHGLLKKDIIFIIKAIYTLKNTIFVAYIFKYLRKRGKLNFFFKKRLFRDLEHQNPSIILGDIGRASEM